MLVHPVPQALVVSPRQTPGAEPIPVHGARKFAAHAETADSTPIPEARILWEVGDTGIIARDSPREWSPHRPWHHDAQRAAPRIRAGGLEHPGGSRGPCPRPSRASASARRTARSRPGSWTTRASRSGRPASLEWASDKPATVDPLGYRRGERRESGARDGSRDRTLGQRSTADVYVLSDLLVTSNRGGTPGIYQARSAGPDSLVAFLADSRPTSRRCPHPTARGSR